MLSLRRLNDVHLLVLALVGIILFALLKTSTGADVPRNSHSVQNAGPDGAMALRMWLEKSGFEVRQLSNDSAPPDDVDVLFILEPAFSFTAEEAFTIYNWVMEGHTLIVGGYNSNLDSLLQPFEVMLPRLVVGQTASPASPTLTEPPFDHLTVGWASEIESTHTDLVVHLVVKDKPILASLSVGQGILWVAGTARPFTNYGLREATSARFIINLLNDVPQHATIGFDEGQYSEQPESLTGWLVSTPAGWSILSFATLTMVYHLLRGRRFGRVQPVLTEQLRREPTEYIQAMANLFRRSGQRNEVLRHYKSELLHRLATRYAFDLPMKDKDVLEILSRRDPALDVGALAQLLHDLSAQQVSEQQLVQIIAHVDDWIGDEH